MFIEVTPANKDDKTTVPVTINFADVRSFYWDKQIGATILRFFDDRRTNFPVQEDIQAIQASLIALAGFSSARQAAAEAGADDDHAPKTVTLNSAS